MNFDWTKEAPTRRQWLLGGGHLAALWAIAFVQPLLDLLGKNPDFFVARGNTPGDILILAIGFTLVPPLVMLAIDWVGKKIDARVYWAVHLLMFTAISVFLFIGILSNFFESPTILLCLLSGILAVLLAWFAYRSTFIRNLLDILIVAPVVILLLFVFTSESSDVIFPKEETVDIGTTTDSKTPVVMVIFDELGTSTLMTKDSQVDGQRFPNFKKLENQSTWYPNESTTSYFTPTAVPGILTGSIPEDGDLPTAADHPDNLFSMLSGSYGMHVEEPITQICPTSLCPAAETDQNQKGRLKSLVTDLKYVEGRLVLPPRIAATLPDVGTNFEGFGGGDDSEDADTGKPLNKAQQQKEDLFVKGQGGAKDPSAYSEFIQEIPAKGTNLTMMHVKQPHQPWKYDVNGELYDTNVPIEQLSDSTGPWLVDENGVTTTQQRQIVQTGYADNLLGQVMKRLKSTGTWDKSMVIVMADHGISFQGGDIPQRQAGTESMGEVANPPLFIKYPDQKKGRIDPVYSKTLDVVPTIAKELGVQGMFETDGVPLQGDDVPVRDVTVKDVKGNDFTEPMSTVLAQRKQAIARKDDRFGTGPLYTLGPAPELIGKPAPPVPAGSDEATLDSPGKYANYKPGKSPAIPMWVTGSLDGPQTGSTIVVGVNGRIMGTTKSFDFEDTQRFGTIVNPASLKAGANTITVYEVDNSGKLFPLGTNE